MKYIKNKSIEQNKTNNVPDLSGISEVAWNFISAFYKSGWDLLVFDKDSWTFRQKVASKFTPKVQEIKTKSKNNKQTNKLASFVKLPPPILVKTLKEVKEISKFFKKNSQLAEKKDTKKSYVQASSLFSTTSKILKIKETFPKL